MKTKNKVSSDLFPNTPITEIQSTYFPHILVAQLAGEIIFRSGNPPTMITGQSQLSWWDCSVIWTIPPIISLEKLSGEITLLQIFNLCRSGNPPTKITGQSQGETERREKVGKAKNSSAT